MLFTSPAFLLVFLPLALAGFFWLGRWSASAAAAWLFVASTAFYGYWMPVFTALLLASISANFALGLRIAALRHDARRAAKRMAAFGIALNLSLLAYFKYFNFFTDNVCAIAHLECDFSRVILPVGISFYTFTQIAFLVDSLQGKVGETRFAHYGLFVTYFPHLIAGPVLHHAQMMPQFANDSTYRWQSANFVAGLVIFAIGMVKKIVLGDGISPYADVAFNAADAGMTPSAAEAWLAALAYTFHLYFDFSGYSDMAVGLSLMFNIRLPFNFNSPYRATSISDFWRRWHISLSTFLRDYLYVPLGGNRRGRFRRYANLLTTMVLGGLWHGANWSFVVWGALHGLFLAVNHAYRSAIGERLIAALDRSRLYVVLSWAVTLVAVIVGWVFFRATTLEGAERMLVAMAGFAEAQSNRALLWNAGLHLETGAMWCVALAFLALWPRNSNVMGETVARHLSSKTHWRPLAAGMSLSLIALLLVLASARDSVSPFIYFNF